MRLLIVEDNEEFAGLLAKGLQTAGYQADLLSTVKEARNVLHTTFYSALILDLGLPDGDGLTLLREIRDSNNPIPVLVLTARGGLHDRVHGLRSGADDYLVKPFDSSEMLARIGVGLRITDLHRQLEQKSAQLEEAATTDSLTGLPNRRAIEEWANKQLKGAARHGFPVWVVLCDLDSFKEVNDTFGHEAGDTVLRTFANTLKSLTRISDMCGRLGGDEFLIVISHVNADNIELAINRFREMFSALSFPFVGQSVSVTSTFGVAGSESGNPKDFEALVRKADEMLYEAKRAGRNCVRIATLS